MGKNFPLFLAVAGGALVYFLWRQKQSQAVIAHTPARASVPQEWVENTPEGYAVIGTTGDPWDLGPT
jgi:hypothetical protein